MMLRNVRTKYGWFANFSFLSCFADVTCPEFGTDANPLPQGVIVHKDGDLAVYDSKRRFTCSNESARFSGGLAEQEAVCCANGEWSRYPSSCAGYQLKLY